MKSLAPILLHLPLHRGRGRVLHLEPIARPAGAIGRAEPLRYDAFEAELASVAHSLSVSVSYKGPLLFPSK